MSIVGSLVPPVLPELDILVWVSYTREKIME
jgi:hypothetical protein